MKKLIFLLVAPVLSGCLSTTAPVVSHWMLEYDSSAKPAVSEPRFGVTRVAQIVVAAPYDSTRLTVLRADGTVAFDPYNEYAAQPSRLLKGVLRDAALASGLFQSVVGAGSASSTTVSLEVIVTSLALDCRRAGERRAVASVQLRLIDRKDVTISCRGSGAADATDGNFGKALSVAVSAALSEAFGRVW